jgi:hypothetical protein
MLVRQRVKAVTYGVEFLSFTQNCGRRHWVPECLESLRRGKLQVGRLSSENLKEGVYLRSRTSLINAATRVVIPVPCPFQEGYLQLSSTEKLRSLDYLSRPQSSPIGNLRGAIPEGPISFSKPGREKKRYFAQQ